MRRILVALALASLPAVIAAQNNGRQRSAEPRSLLGVRDRLGSAAVARRLADHLHARLDRQDQRQARVVAVDHERRRQQEPLPRPRQQRALVADRRSHRLHRAGRSEGLADLRALHGRRRRRSRRSRTSTNRRRNVAWSPDGTVDSRFAMKVEKKNAWPIKMPRAPRRRQVGRGAAHRRAARLPPGRPGLQRRRLPAPVRGAGHRRHAAPADQRRLGSQRRRVDARRQADPLHVAARRRRRLRSGANRRSIPSTSTPARSRS